MKIQAKNRLAPWPAKTWIVAAGIVVLGVLAAMSLIGNGASAGGDLTEMEATYRNYDWGVTRPGGQAEEDKHRQHLQDKFSVRFANHDDYRGFRVSIPNTLVLRNFGLFNNKTAIVLYDVESIFHKYVEDKAECDNERSEGTTHLQDFIYSTRQKAVDVWQKVEPGDRSLHSCLIVKLKGNMPVYFDTHPEWAFFAAVEPVWPDIRVVADENGARVYSLAGASGLRFDDFRYRILDEADSCNRSAFDVAPNHPAVHRSIQFDAPDSLEARAYYYGRYICFRATVTNIDHPDYDIGDYAYRYDVAQLNLTTLVVHLSLRETREEPPRQEIRGWISGTTRPVVWDMASSSEDDHCNAYGFSDDSISVYPIGTGRGFTYRPGGSSGKYICFRATDGLGNHFYKSIWYQEAERLPEAEYRERPTHPTD